MFSDFSFSSEINVNFFSDSFSSNSSKSSFENNVNSSSTPFTNENRFRNRTSSRNETRNRNISLFTGLPSSESHSPAIRNINLRNRNASRTEFSNRHRIRTAASFSNNESNHSSNFSFNDLPSPIIFAESESLNNSRNRNSSRSENVIGHGMTFVADGNDQTESVHLESIIPQLPPDFLTHSDYSRLNNLDFDSNSSAFLYQSEISSINAGSHEDINNNPLEFDRDYNNNIVFHDANSSTDSSPLFYVPHTISSIGIVDQHNITPEYDVDFVHERPVSDVGIYHYEINANDGQDSSNSHHSLSYSHEYDIQQSPSAPRMKLFESNDLSNDDFFQ